VGTQSRSGLQQLEKDKVSQRFIKECLKKLQAIKRRNNKWWKGNVAGKRSKAAHSLL